MKTPSKQPQVAKPKKASRLQVVKLEPRLAPGTSMQHNETLVREPAKLEQPAPAVRKSTPKPKLQVVKLEERIAPRFGGGGCDEFGCGMNHNETLVREPAEEKQLPPAVRKDVRKPKLQIVKLEERIAPRSGGCDEWGCGMNHNETLVRDAVKMNAPKLKKVVSLKVVKLEQRIAPGIRMQNHNETLVRDRA
jgi:hypothetical protein